MNLPPYSPILLKASMRNLLIPTILIHLVLPSCSLSLRLLIHIITPTLVYVCYTTSLRWFHARHARLLGAQLIPVIKSRTDAPWYLKWGNIDLMLAWDREGKSGYLGEGMVRSGVEGIGGTVNTRILGEDSMITTSPRHILQILTTSHSSFPKGTKFHERAKDFMGPKGVFVSDTEDWVFHRNSTRPFFAHTTTLNPAEVFEPSSTRFISLLHQPPSTLSESNKEHRAIDAQALALVYTMDVASSFLFGQNVDGLVRLEDAGKRESSELEVEEKQGAEEGVGGEELARAFSKAQAVLARRIKMGTPWALFELTGNQMTRPVQTIKRFIRPLVDKAIERDQDGGKEKGEKGKGVLLDHLVKVMKDRDAIEDELINILVAARDTTASALTFCIYCLALYPEIAERLREEVCSSPAELVARDLKVMKLLNAFVLEVLRLYPPVPMNIRRSSEAVLLQPSDADSPPLYMPKETSIILAILLMQRSKEVWGKDAEEFKPERWLTTDEDDQSQVSEARRRREGFVAFNAGPRTCLGQNFALMQLSYVMAKLLRSLSDPETKSALYTVVLAPDEQPKATSPPEAWKDLLGRGTEEKVWVASNLTLYVKGGLWVRMIKSV